jgi:hypothetical protein
MQRRYNHSWTPLYHFPGYETSMQCGMLDTSKYYTVQDAG